MLAYPAIDPVALQIGPLAIRWYALAYITGVILGWRYALYLAKRNPTGPAPQLYDDVVSWIILGILLGGRLGYILFYNGDFYAQHPLQILELWHGGMSSHGGILGVILAPWIFTRRHKVNYLAFTDVLACVVPIGIFFGRIANFINGELYGRAADVPWAMIFPRGGDIPRHPSQLYQAGLEGLLLLAILAVLAHQPKWRRHIGFLSGCFLLGYALLRTVGEFFREPDAQLGFLIGGITMGQLLSIPIAAFGLFLIWRSFHLKHDAP